jgi:hypothetical protein
MHWFWEQLHYRRETGDLIMDRIFDHHEPGRAVPDNFGVRLTGDNVGPRLARQDMKLRQWMDARTEELAPIKSMADRAPRNVIRQAEMACW